MRNTGYQYILAVHGRILIDKPYPPGVPVEWKITDEPYCYASGKTREAAVKAFCRTNDYNTYRLRCFEYCEKDGTTII